MKSMLNSAAGKPSIRIPRLAAIASDLECMMEVCRNFANVAEDAKDVRLAFDSLLMSCHNTLDCLADMGGRATTQDMLDAECAAQMDALRDSLIGRMPLLEALGIPAVSGGGHDDDFEEIDEAFEADPAGWPGIWHAELDGYCWTTSEPTPIDVLAASAPTWEPTDEDWSELYAASGAGVSEADHYAAHACV